MNCPPVLLLIFNRPGPTRLVFETIRKARPSKLFVAADGPRAGKPGEAERCEETRQIAAAVDWPCKVKTLFREQNLGCARAVSEAITWFFEQVEAGVILEDDCVADPSFFPFCQELLDRYRTDDRIMQISGFSPHRIKAAESYIFAYSGGIWGWATWRRAWQHFDLQLPQTIEAEALQNSLHDDVALRYWIAQFERTARQPAATTWAVPWYYTRLVNQGLSIIPRSNLVENIGIGQESTHTKSPLAFKVRTVEPVEFPLVHPDSVSRNLEYERRSFALTHQLEMPEMNLCQYLACGLRNRVASLLRYMRE